MFLTFLTLRALRALHWLEKWKARFTVIIHTIFSPEITNKSHLIEQLM